MYEDKASEGEAETQGGCKVVFGKIQIYTAPETLHLQRTCAFNNYANS